VTATRPPAPAFVVPWWMRVVLPAVVTAVLQVGITVVAGRHQPEAGPLDALGVALLLVGPAALLIRLSRPVLALGVAFAASMTYWLIDYPRGPAFLALGVAFVTARLRGHRNVAWASLAAGYVLTAWVAPALVEDGPWPSWGAVAGLAAWLLALGAVTELAYTWIQRSAERAQAEAEEARRRASEERLRIARELHDVLAHNISLINVRAGVALHLIDEQPAAVGADQVRPALAAIKEASKDALGELRSVLDVLRQGEAAPLAPTAGLRDLDELVERASGTGLEVAVELDGDAIGGLPAGVDLAAFRIVQEALTNVVRHADATRATVRVRRGDDVLELTVDDDGRGAATPPAGGSPSRSAIPGRHGATGGARAGAAPAGGQGISGMRERALALGGSLEAGPRPGRGFRVRARLPLPASVVATPGGVGMPEDAT
jgi:signal transduction histidine kinase